MSNWFSRGREDAAERPVVPTDEESVWRQPRTDSVPEGMKRCTRCEIDFPIDGEHFHRGSHKLLGLDSWCKSCVSVRSKRYRQITGRAATHRPEMEAVS